MGVYSDRAKGPKAVCFPRLVISCVASFIVADHTFAVERRAVAFLQPSDPTTTD